MLATITFTTRQSAVVFNETIEVKDVNNTKEIRKTLNKLLGKTFPLVDNKPVVVKGIHLIIAK